QESAQATQGLRGQASTPMSTTTKTNMEWLPENVEKLLGDLAKLATIGGGLARLKQSLSKRGKKKRDLEQLAQELDELRKDFEKLVEVLTPYFKKHREL